MSNLTKKLETLLKQKEILGEIIYSREKIVETRLGNTPEWNTKLNQSRIQMDELNRSIADCRAELKHSQHQTMGNP